MLVVRYEKFHVFAIVGAVFQTVEMILLRYGILCEYTDHKIPRW